MFQSVDSLHTRSGQGPVISQVAQVPYTQYGGLADPVSNMPGYKIGRGARFNEFEYETIKKSYDIWLGVTPKLPGAFIIYEIYDYRLVPTVPVEATAFPQRTAVRAVRPQPPKSASLIKSLHFHALRTRRPWLALYSATRS